MNRRDLLEGLGASAVGLLGVSGVTAARDGGPVGVGDASNDENLPIAARGETVHVYEPLRGDSEEVVAYKHQRHFFSDDVRERYGRDVIPFEPRIVHDEWVPVGESSAPSELPSRYRRQIDTTEGSVAYLERDRTRVIGLPGEHRESYRRAKRELGAMNVGFTDVPRYLFESESGADGEKFSARQAPVNVVWKDWDASSVDTYMKNGFGGSNTSWDNSTIAEIVDEVPWFNIRTRYAPDPNTDTVYSHDYDIQKDDGQSCGFPYRDKWSQYHIRAFEFADADDIGAFGNVHRDPCDHNQNPVTDSEPWQYVTARNQVEDFWSSFYYAKTETLNLYNTYGISSPGDTHDGNAIVVKNAP